MADDAPLAAPADPHDRAIGRYAEAAGLHHVRIQPTHAVGAGITAAIVQASKPAVVVRDMRADDWPEVSAIYAEGITGGDATFETELPTWQEWNGAHLPDHRHVAVDDGTGQLLGWTAVTPVSSRCVYAGVVEHSVYVAAAAQGRGVGRALLAALVASTERAGIWTIQSGVFPENEVSLALHRSAGFRVVGTRERVGRMHGRWRDVIALERRSQVVGS